MSLVPIKQVPLPTYKLPTIPSTTVKPPATTQAKAQFDWSSVLDRVFDTGAKILEWQTEKERAKNPAPSTNPYDYYQADTPGPSSSGGGGGLSLPLLAGIGVAAYLILK